MKEMVPFFKKQQLIKCHLLKTSSDPDVRMLYEARAAKEKKLSTPSPSKLSKRAPEGAFSSTAARSVSRKIVQNRWRPCVELQNLLS